jgi:hypothetical protein
MIALNNQYSLIVLGTRDYRYLLNIDCQMVLWIIHITYAFAAINVDFKTIASSSSEMPSPSEKYKRLSKTAKEKGKKKGKPPGGGGGGGRCFDVSTLIWRATHVDAYRQCSNDYLRYSKKETLYKNAYTICL